MDYIGATPQSNPLLGLLAERLKQAQQFAAKPFGYQNPPAEMLMNLLGIPAVQQTAERMAYGEPLTTGRGMTTQVRPEVMEAAMTVAPAAGLLGRGVERGAMAAGRAGERYAEKVVPQIMERGGMPAQLLGDLSQGTMSRVAPQSIVREGNPIQSAVVLIGDRMFTGRTHSEAFNRAIYEGAVRKEGGKFIYPKDAEVNSDLFMTKDGQIIDRLQASKMFDIGASETAIAEGLMQNKPPSSMSVDSYIEQATAIRKAREKQSLLD
jgi:hypothetical protein